MKFLVVEDEPNVAASFRRAFESDGHACVAVSSVDEATQVITRERIDGIVLDLNAPESEGVAWLEGLSKRRPRLTRSTVVASATEIAGDDRRHIAKLGAVLLMKPFSLETLRSVFLEQVARQKWLARAHGRRTQHP